MYGHILCTTTVSIYGIPTVRWFKNKKTNQKKARFSKKSWVLKKGWVFFQKKNKLGFPQKSWFFFQKKKVGFSKKAGFSKKNWVFKKAGY